MNTHQSQGRGPQARPTKSELRGYWRLLKQRANEGDTQAIEAVIRLTQRQHEAI